MVVRGAARVRPLVRLTIVAAVLFAGCGHGDAVQPLAPRDAAALRAELASARSAAAAKDPARARSALRAFRRKVTGLQRGGRIDGADAAALLNGARNAERRVATDVHPAPAPVQPAPVQPAPTPAPAQPKVHKPKNGKGQKGFKGHGGDGE
jgi:hypothetical protein